VHYSGLIVKKQRFLYVWIDNLKNAWYFLGLLEMGSKHEKGCSFDHSGISGADRDCGNLCAYRHTVPVEVLGAP
jgi:hypothetical protein